MSPVSSKKKSRPFRRKGLTNSEENNQAEMLGGRFVQFLDTFSRDHNGVVALAPLWTSIAEKGPYHYLLVPESVRDAVNKGDKILREFR